MTDSNSGLPADWDSWPRAERVEYVDMVSTRAGLIAELSERCEFDLDAINNQYRLDKPQLAAITLELRERPERPEEPA